MDKKNTMLLTVIAVATLLVAVVGATFAYFTVSNSATTGTNVGVEGSTTAAPGTVTLQGKTVDLVLNMKATHMLNTTESKGKYYAVVSGDPAKDDDQQHVMAVLTTSNNDTGKYTCYYTLNITATGLEDLEADLKEVDGAVVLSTSTDTTATVSYDKATVPFTALVDGTEKVVATINITGNQGATFLADAYIENANAEQNYLASLDLGIDIVSAQGTTDFTCNVID